MKNIASTSALNAEYIKTIQNNTENTVKNIQLNYQYIDMLI